MTPSFTPADIVSMRMRALLLTENLLTDPAEVVKHLFALQGQDFPAATWAMAIRAGTPDSPVSRSVVAEAFNSGKVVRSWPMRGTVHLMRAEDIGWMQQLTNPTILRHWPQRREYLELDMGVYESVREITLSTLTGGKSLPREALVEQWQASGIEMKQGWSYHLIWAMCQHGDTVFGPMNEYGDLELVVANEWIKEPTEYDEDEALAEFCVRYFTGHGPATVQDLMWWSQLPARALKVGLKTAGERLVEIEAAGATYFVTPDQLEGYLPSKSLIALTPFDEYLLGFKDRSLVLYPENARKVMTINGISQPTIVKDGRIKAAWKVRDGSYEVLPGEKVSKRDLAATERRINEARTWLGRT